MYVLKHQVSWGRRSVWLSEQDIELLQIVYEFKNISLYQIKYFWIHHHIL